MTPADPPERPAGRGSGDDPFSWLYQRGQPAPTEEVPPAVPPTVAPQPTHPPVPPPTPPMQPPPTGTPPGPQPSYLLDPYRPGQQPVYVAPPPEAPKQRGPLVGIIVGVVLVAAVAAGAVVAVLIHRSRTIIDYGPAPSTVATPRVSTSAAAPPVPTGVSADCTAPAATDDAGTPVAYDAGNVLDGDPSTAWRCDGKGAGHVLTFTFPAGVTVSKVGLINGYAKTDPKSGAKRYGEYRRVTRVTWTFDNHTTFTQTLSGKTPKLQTMSIDPTQAQTVTLTIDDSTKPGWSASSRNAVLISEVSFR